MNQTGKIFGTYINACRLCSDIPKVGQQCNCGVTAK